MSNLNLFIMKGKAFRRSVRKSSRSFRTKGGVRRHLRGLRKKVSRYSRRGKPQKVRVSRGGIRL